MPTPQMRGRLQSISLKVQIGGVRELSTKPSGVLQGVSMHFGLGCFEACGSDYSKVISSVLYGESFGYTMK